jgi:ElaB/YqjD/DUF883 family membrane-anchored ribosome-binding protein
MTTAQVTVVPTENVNIKSDDVGLAKESGGNLAAAKSDLDTISGQVDAKTSTLAKESGGNLAAVKSDLDTVSGQLDAKTSTLAKESGGNLAAAKADLDTISGQLDAKTSTLAKESGGNLAAIKPDADSIVTNTTGLAKESGGNLAGVKADLDTISGQLDAKTSTLAKESGGNLASIKSDADSIVTNTTGLAKETGGNLAAAKSDLDTMSGVLSNVEDSSGPQIVTLPKAKGKTPLIEGNTATNGSSTIYTVTSGKTFYFVGGTLTAGALAASVTGLGYLEVDTGGNGTFRMLGAIPIREGTGSSAVAVGCLTVSPTLPIPISQGSVFRVRSTVANLEAVGTIMGWEE